MMTVSASNLLCCPSAPTSHRTKSICKQHLDYMPLSLLSLLEQVLC